MIDMIHKPTQYALATCTREATAAGSDIIAAGGNAVDVLVGVALELTVSAIMMTSLCGGGFAIIRTPDGKVEFLDFFDVVPGKGVDLEKYRKNNMPEKVHLDYGLGYDVMVGPKSVSVPGVAKGLAVLNKKYGSMPIKELIQPAIEHAKKGTKFNRNIYDFFSVSAKEIHWATQYARDIFSKPDGSMPDIDTVIKQKDYAQTLEYIADNGLESIYTGDLAEAIIKEVHGGGGLLTHEDLKTYEAIWREPLYTNYKGKSIWTNPPPSVGGVTMIEILNILAHHKQGKELTPQDVAVIGKAQRQALFHKYNKYLDPNTNEEVAKILLSPEHAIDSYRKIQPPSHTTHISYVDNAGYAVGLTMSMGYGSGVSVPGSGLFLTNSLGEMDLNPRGYLKARSGEKLISGMTPSIMYDPITEDLFSLGSAGSARIPTSLAHVIMNLTDFDMSLQDAIKAPRCHYEDDEFAIESGIDVDETLLDDKTKVCRFETMERFFGGTNVARAKKGGLLQASNDPRRSGAAQVITI